jgi:hypothetical protein
LLSASADKVAALPMKSKEQGAAMTVFGITAQIRPMDYWRSRPANMKSG